MIEHSIIFSGDMARVLEGRKTQTRRVIKSQPSSTQRWEAEIFTEHNTTFAKFVMLYYFINTSPFAGIVKCPYGQSGDRLWVKETWANAPHGIIYKANFNTADGFGSEVVDLPTGRTIPLVWKSPRFMSRRYSRITLEILSIRAQRLQDITEEDCCAEMGIPLKWPGPGSEPYKRDLRTSFSYLWDAINAKRGFGWNVNPWVWVIEFRKMEEMRNDN
jgi:hypothetical protein